MSRTIHALLLTLALLVGALTLVAAAPAVILPPAEAAIAVSKQTCRAIDPHLVNGVCLRYSTGSGTAYTWLGTLRAADGRVFFCIDYLYDSRLPRGAEVVATDDLVNQLGDRIGDDEVAALNYVISRWAGRGSTGSDHRDAAIALIIREVMGDGVRRDGTVVHPPGLEVGERVRPPIGGLAGRVLRLARQMWMAGSRYRGAHTVTLTTRDRDRGPVRLGRTRTYRVAVTSAAGHRVPGVPVRFACTGPVRCPRPVVTKRRSVRIVVGPRATGRYRIKAAATGPSSDGRLYVVDSWRSHDGATARRAGVQRGWIAGRSRTTAVVGARARIVRARPEVVTRTSDAEVTPGASIHDLVEVSGLTNGYAETVLASLHGPFPTRPGPGDCTDATRFGQVTFDVDRDGSYVTPPITVDEIGYYTWVEELPGDRWTVPVTTPCGLVEETTLVARATPEVSTVASTQHALVGSTIHDTVVVRGLPEATTVTVTWRLHGPVAPRRGGSCDRLDWRGAPIADRGVFVVRGDGVHRSGRTRLRAAGCYTYSQQLPLTASTTAVRSEPGIPAETALVTRPAIPFVPEVPTGPTRPARGAGPRSLGPLVLDGPKTPEHAVAPTARVRPRFLTTRYRSPATSRRRAAGGTLQIPAVGITAPVDAVRLDRGTMAIPNDPRRVGWLDRSAGADDRIGSSVISGHVSDRRDRPGALWRLRHVEVGDRVRWRAAGRTAVYEVTGVRRHPRATGLPAGVFRTDGRRVLRLVTCAGRVRRGGGFHYTDNLVVTAALR